MSGIQKIRKSFILRKLLKDLSFTIQFLEKTQVTLAVDRDSPFILNGFVFVKEKDPNFKIGTLDSAYGLDISFMDWFLGLQAVHLDLGHLPDGHKILVQP